MLMPLLIFNGNDANNACIYVVSPHSSKNPEFVLSLSLPPCPPPLFRDNLAITGSGRVEDRDKTVRREQGIREAGASKGNDQARVAEQQGGAGLGLVVLCLSSALH